MIYLINNYKRVIKLSWSILLFNKTHKKKKLTLWPLFMDGVQLPQG